MANSDLLQRANPMVLNQFDRPMTLDANEAAKLYLWLKKKLSDPEKVDDIYQETLARVFATAKKKVIGPPGVSAYAFRIAANLIVDSHRKKQLDTTELVDSAPSELAGPEETLTWKQDMVALKKALDKMPKLRREIFIRVRIKFETYEELSIKTGLSVKAIEKHVTRALADLHEVRQAVKNK